MKILAIAPVSFLNVFPVGLSYIVAVLKKNGFAVECMTYSSEMKIPSEGYDFVATGGLACHFKQIEHIIALSKSEGIATILGGGIVTSEPEFIARYFKMDYAVIGEGEETIIELLHCLEQKGNLESVPGLGFFRGEQFVLTDKRKPIRELDRLPYPDYDAFSYSEFIEKQKPSSIFHLDYFDHPRNYPILGSRSCPFQCTFCYHPLGQIYRQRSIDSIIEELRIAIPKYKINFIDLYDELFSHNIKRLQEFCDRIKELRQEFSWEIRWGCSLRVDKLNNDIYQSLIDSGCLGVSLGLESYSKKILVSMKKRIKPEDIHKCIHDILELPLALQGNFILGDPEETLETLLETLNFWKEHKNAGIMLVHLLPFPNSKIYQHFLQKNIINDKIDYYKNRMYEFFNMTNMSEEDFSFMKTCLWLYPICFNIYSVPERVEENSVTVRCPHCKRKIRYANYDITELNDMFFFIRPSLLVFNKMAYCRICRRRFWIRSCLFQLAITPLLLFRIPFVLKLFKSIKNAVMKYLKRKS